MKGVYLTPEAKQEIEAKMAQLEKEQKTEGEALYIIGKTMINTYKEILASATILPVEKSWEVVLNKPIESLLNNESETLEDFYPQGVIIQSKK